MDPRRVKKHAVLIRPPEDERMLKNVLMELNDTCEDYGMKINISNMKAMVIRRKPKKIDM